MKSFFRFYGWVIIVFLISLAGLISVGRLYWLQSIEHHQKDLSEELAQKLGLELVRGQVTPQEMYRQFVFKEPRIGYIVMSNHRSGYRSGLVNTGGLSEGAQEVVDFFKEKGTNKTLNKLIQKGEGFPSEHLDVYSVAILPPAFDSNPKPVGMVKVAYVVPGYPYGRGYEKLWWILSGILGLFTFAATGLWSVARRLPTEPKSPMIIRQNKVDELDQLEEAMQDQPTSEIDELGREWRNLFDGKDLSGWRKRGDVYITEREMAFQPWGASMVYDGMMIPGKYHFQTKVRQLAGSDGFIVLFSVDEKHLVWVIGGWNNTRAEVLGYIDTQRLISVDRGIWYKIEVRVEDEVRGFINDSEVWKLSRNEIQSSSSDCGFQQGLGLATWGSFYKAKDIRFLDR